MVHVGDMRGACRVLVGKLEGRKPLGRPTSRWEDNTKMDIQEVERGDLAQDRNGWRPLRNAEMKLRFQNTKNFLANFSRGSVIYGGSFLIDK